MLTHLVSRIAAAFAPVQQATLATTGPAGLLAQVLPCAADGIRLFLLVPRTSDHLLNLEESPQVAIATATWNMLGHVRALYPEQSIAMPQFADRPDKPWCVTLEIAPVRVHLARRNGWGATETFDLDGEQASQNTPAAG